MSDAPYEAERVQRRHNPVVVVLAALLLAIVGRLVTFMPFAVVGVELVGAALWVMLMVVATKPRAIERRVKVSARRGELWLDESRVDARAVRSACVLHDRGANVVRIERRFSPAIEIIVESIGDGRELLHALGYDATQAIARFRTASRLRGYPELLLTAALMLVPIAALAGVIAHSIALPAAIVASVLALVAWPSRVEVGPDGVRYTWLAWRTFLPATQIEAAEDIAENRTIVGVRLKMRDGRVVPIPSGRMPAALQTGAALAERVREVMASPAAVDAPPYLARGGLGARDWIAALRALAPSESYRAMSIDEEGLWRVVETANASASDRAAAAVALARDDDARGRLRVAASAIAEPRLRVALEAAAGEDESELERALDDLREL